MIACPICSSTFCEPGFKVFDDRFGFPGEFTLWSCPECRHQFLDPSVLPKDLVHLYSNYYPRREIDPEKIHALPEPSGWNGWWRGDRRAFALVPGKSRVLDIGCGACETLLYHRDKASEAYGIEADSNVQRVADKYGLNFQNGVFGPGLYESSFFDYVTMDQVIEHLPDLDESMTEIHRILKPDGRLVFTTPNGEGWGAQMFGSRWINWHAPYHRHFFSWSSLEKLAKKHGFILEDVRTVTSSAWTTYQLIHLTDHPRVGEKHEFWANAGRGDRPLLASEWVLKKLVSKVQKWQLDCAWTRVMDALGLGDNFIAIFKRAS